MAEVKLVWLHIVRAWCEGRNHGHPAITDAARLELVREPDWISAAATGASVWNDEDSHRTISVECCEVMSIEIRAIC